MKPILLIILISISSFTTRRVHATEAASTETATTEFVSEVIAIKYVKAEDIAEVLNYLSGSGNGNKDNIRQLLRHASLTNGLPSLGKINLLADRRSNSIQISATQSDLETIKNVASKLDVVFRQILIETVVLEVQLPDSKSATRKQSGPKPATPEDRFLRMGVRRSTNFVASALSADATTGQLDDLSYVAVLGNGFDSILAALINDRDLTIIQKPRIQTSDGTPASLFVGATYNTGYERGGGPGGYYPLQTGIGLEMTPTIHPDGLVMMNIRQSVDKLGEATCVENAGDVPNTVSKVSYASVPVRDGEILMIGGLIKTTKSQRANGIPILRSIPLLGGLFRGSSNHRPQTELVVLLRPTVLQ